MRARSRRPGGAPGIGYFALKILQFLTQCRAVRERCSDLQFSSMEAGIQTGYQHAFGDVPRAAAVLRHFQACGDRHAVRTKAGVVKNIGDRAADAGFVVPAAFSCSCACARFAGCCW